MERPDEHASLTPLDVAARLREEADTRIEGRLRVLPSATPATCRAGCSACCHQLVVVSPLEAHAIAKHLEADPELAQAARERLERWRQRVDQSEELAAALERFGARSGYLSPEDGDALEIAYWRAQIPCPFLDAGRCSIYAVRPFACREHHVTSDPALCSQDPDRVSPAGTRMEFRAVANWTGTAAFGLPDRLLLLARAWDYAAAHPEETEREAPEPVVRDVHADAQRRARMALARVLLAQRGTIKAEGVE